jgi:hypothetical protein
MTEADSKGAIEKLVGEYRLIKWIDVMHCGWEGDTQMWLVQPKNSPKPVAITTSHGRHYVMQTQEVREKVEEYMRAWRETKDFLDAITP